jgi:glycosyltransferase involved in cell wall biosynthesis
MTQPPSTANSQAPAISVVMPLYNRAATVRAAIDSVLAQTFADFELIVVDDGSTDGSADVVAAIGDPRLMLVRLGSNGGGNAARNEGIRRARGRIVSFLDSDDLYLPNKLAHVAAAFAARPSLGGMIDSFRKQSTRKGERMCLNPDLEDPHAILKALFDRRLWKSTPGISVSRDAALRAGLFDESLRRRQDFDFLVRLIDTADFVSMSTVTWVKTVSEDSISGALDSFMPSFMEFWDRHPRYYDDPDFRIGFAADLVRHYVSALRRGRFGLFARDIAPIRRKIGWGGLIGSIALGVGELNRLRRHRQGLGQIWSKRSERGERLEAARQ